MAKNKNKSVNVTGKAQQGNARVRLLDGKKVQPCLYNGRASGHGHYLAAMVDNALVLDPTGKPVPFWRCGQLVRA